MRFLQLAAPESQGDSRPTSCSAPQTRSRQPRRGVATSALRSRASMGTAMQTRLKHALNQYHTYTVPLFSNAQFFTRKHIALRQLCSHLNGQHRIGYLELQFKSLNRPKLAECSKVPRSKRLRNTNLLMRFTL